MGKEQTDYPRDERLMRDVGLSREFVLGPARSFWSQWQRHRELWRL